MKFGQQFKFYKVPEYSDNYLDYDTLKKILKIIIKDHRKCIIFLNLYSIYQI